MTDREKMLRLNAGQLPILNIVDAIDNLDRAILGIQELRLRGFVPLQRIRDRLKEIHPRLAAKLQGMEYTKAVPKTFREPQSRAIAYIEGWGGDQEGEP